MEYKLPNLMEHGNYIRSLYPDDAIKMKQDIESHLRTVVQALQNSIDKQVESWCDICACAGYGYESLPAGWGWLEEGTLICNKCVTKWSVRFGETPALNTKGEVVYEQDRSVSENPTHRGQANFEFV